MQPLQNVTAGVGPSSREPYQYSAFLLTSMPDVCKIFSPFLADFVASIQM